MILKFWCHFEKNVSGLFQELFKNFVPFLNFRKFPPFTIFRKFINFPPFLKPRFWKIINFPPFFINHDFENFDFPAFLNHDFYLLKYSRHFSSSKSKPFTHFPIFSFTFQTIKNKINKKEKKNTVKKFKFCEFYLCSKAINVAIGLNN